MEHAAAMRMSVPSWAASAAHTASMAWAALTGHGRAAAATAPDSDSAPAPLSSSGLPERRRNPITSTTSRAVLSRPAAKASTDPCDALTTADGVRTAAVELQASVQADDASLCLVRIDVDGLDTLAARYGDDAVAQVLRQATKRLRHLARAEDLVLRTAEPHGFVLMLACPKGSEATVPAAMSERAALDLQRPYTFRTLSNLRVSCTAGSAVWPQHGATVDEALQHARAVLDSKRQRRIPSLIARP